jgi:fructosamine-3-kinase
MRDDPNPDAPGEFLRGASAGTFTKRRADAPVGFFRWEASGLEWLAAATGAGGVAVVPVQEVGVRHIVVGRVDQVPASTSAAESFGRALAVTHAQGADTFGVGPPGWSGDGWIGRQPLALQSFSRWGEFYARTRVLPYARKAVRAGTLDEAGLGLIERLCVALIAGDYDDGNPPARIHGDLWGGNLLYSAGGAVLIDPAAHGGHGLTDLGMLALFGTEHLDRVKASYAEAAGLANGWQEMIGLHQLHPLLVHAVTHGPHYGRAAHGVAVEYT